MITDPWYPLQVSFMKPEQSSSPRQETLGSFSWFNCYNAELRAIFVRFCKTFDLIFETRPSSLTSFLLIMRFFHLVGYT